MENKFYLKSKEVLEEFTNSGLVFKEEWIFGDKLISEIKNEEEMRVIIDNLLVLEAILDIAMPAKFCLIAGGDKEIAVDITPAYIDKRVDKTGPAYLVRVPAMLEQLVDEDGKLKLSMEEYDNIVELIKKVKTMAPIFNFSLFYIKNKRLTNDAIDGGVSQIYSILAPCESLLANFSCEGHIYTDVSDDANLAFSFDTPYIMIDYDATAVDLYELINEITRENYSDKITGAMNTLEKYGYSFDMTRLPSASPKTWNDRVCLGFDTNEIHLSIKGNIMEVMRLNEAKKLMLFIMTAISVEIARKINGCCITK